jgi:hypothetical protein
LEPRVKAHVMVAFLGYALWVTLKRGCADFCVGVRFSTIERNEWRLTKS